MFPFDSSFPFLVSTSKHNLPTLGAVMVGGSVGAVLLNAERGIFICMGPRLLVELWSPEVPTVGKEVLVVCATGCVVETACTANVVRTDPALAGEFLWTPGLDTDGLLFGLVVLVDAKDTAVLVRLPTVDELCTDINSTLPDCWLVTKVPAWPWRSWGWDDTATGTCKITGKDCNETDIGWVLPLGTWLVPTTVAVLAVEITVVVKGLDVTGVWGLGCPLAGVWGAARLEAGATHKHKNSIWTKWVDPLQHNKWKNLAKDYFFFFQRKATCALFSAVCCDIQWSNLRQSIPYCFLKEPHTNDKKYKQLRCRGLRSWDLEDENTWSMALETLATELVEQLVLQKTQEKNN